MASIFNLLENKEASSLSIVNSKVTLLEHIITVEKTVKQLLQEDRENVKDK